MEFTGIGKKDLTRSDSDSSNEETKVSNLPTASSSDSNDSVASESITQPRTTAFVGEVVRQHNARNPKEHDESKSFLSAKTLYLCYLCYLQKR